MRLRLREWFDIYSLTDPGARTDLQVDGLHETITEITRLVAAEAKHLSGPRRIVLAGISQGAAAAVHALLHGLSCPTTGIEDQLAGFVGYCTWMPLIDAFTEAMKPQVLQGDAQRRVSVTLRYWYEAALGLACCSNPEVSIQGEQGLTGCPVLLGHNKDDDVIDFAFGKAMSKVLKDLTMDVHWLPHEDGGHWINSETGDDEIVAFLQHIEGRSSKTSSNAP